MTHAGISCAASQRSGIVRCFDKVICVAAVNIACYAADRSGRDRAPVKAVNHLRIAGTAAVAVKAGVADHTAGGFPAGSRHVAGVEAAVEEGVIVNAADKAAGVVPAADDSADIEAFRAGELFASAARNAAGIRDVGGDVAGVEAAGEFIFICGVQPADDAAGGILAVDRAGVGAIAERLLVVFNFADNAAGVVTARCNRAVVLVVRPGSETLVSRNDAAGVRGRGDLAGVGVA